MLEVASGGDPIRLWAYLGGLGVKPSESQMDLAIFFDNGPPRKPKPKKMVSESITEEHSDELRSLERQQPRNDQEAHDRLERVRLGMAALSRFAKNHPYSPKES